MVNWLERFKEDWVPFLEDQMIIKRHDPDLEERIEKAHREWQEAQNYFNQVTEPELVDYASYRLKAAESKYTYLLNQAKKEDEG